MKIYTRAGDDGRTGLLGKGRVSKADARLEAYGSIDELNAMLGLARAADRDGWLVTQLDAIQRTLFEVGGELAVTDAETLSRLPRASQADVTQLESWIDQLEADLPKLENFVLPGGTSLAAQLHAARTVCRRAERRLVALADVAPVEPTLGRYLNRLGDLLFVMARWCQRRAGGDDDVWKPRGV